MKPSDHLQDEPLWTDNPRRLTVQQAQAIIPDLMPEYGITRLHDLTPFTGGKLPVWAAATPLESDLTQHLGRGRSREEARVGAVFEAIERVAASRLRGTPGVDTTDATGAALSERLAFAVSPDTAGTCRCVNLRDGTERQIPAYFVRSPILSGSDITAWATGLASGSSQLECVWHALKEVLERDLLAQFEMRAFYTRTCPPVPIDTFPRDNSPDAEPDWSHLAARGISVHIFRAKYAWGLRGAVAALVERKHSGPPNIFLGSACDWTWRRSREHAVLEAHQAFAAYQLTSRDSFEGVTNSADLPWPARTTEELVGHWHDALAETRWTHAAQGDEFSGDPEAIRVTDALDSVVSQLADRGHDLVLCCPVLDTEHVKVVRVLIPSLTGPVGSGPWRMSNSVAAAIVGGSAGAS